MVRKNNVCFLFACPTLFMADLFREQPSEFVPPLQSILIIFVIIVHTIEYNQYSNIQLKCALLKLPLTNKRCKGTLRDSRGKINVHQIFITACFLNMNHAFCNDIEFFQRLIFFRILEMKEKCKKFDIRCTLLNITLTLPQVKNA